MPEIVNVNITKYKQLKRHLLTQITKRDAEIVHTCFAAVSIYKQNKVSLGAIFQFFQCM